jgi:hypothetical protein
MNTYDLPAPAALTTSVNDREAVRACESFLTYRECFLCLGFYPRWDSLWRIHSCASPGSG